MNCPRENQWDGLAMGLVEDESAAEALLAHARGCQACRELYKAARQAHTDRIRMYEALDRDHDEQREQLMAALADESPAPLRDGWLDRGRRRLGGLAMSLTNTTTRRTAAILVPVACIVIALVFSMGTEKSAFATAIERMRQAETIISRFQAFIHDTETPLIEGTMYMSNVHGMYLEMGVAGQEMKMYHPIEGPIIIDQSPVNMLITMHGDLGSLGEMQEQPVPDEFVRKLIEMTGEADRELGVSIVDGQAALGFEISGDKLGLNAISPRDKGDVDTNSGVVRLWVATASKLPVRMEVELHLAAFGTMLAVYDQFEWDKPLDDELFTPQVADDAMRIELNIPPATEETLTEALAFCAEMMGRYPMSMDPTGIAMEIGAAVAMSHQSDERELSKDERMQEIMQDALDIQMGALFLQKLARDGAEPEYFGDMVHPDDIDAVLAQWLLDDGSVRVIYGDLRAETIPDESVVAEP